jgi:predicted nucleic acid-binding Zn ribbon protein
MPRFYCVNCGKDFASVRDMIMSPCQKHPLGSFKGNHILYEGSEKSQYTCKYCGKKFSSIRNMTWSPCQYHPKGAFKGDHSPAL